MKAPRPLQSPSAQTPGTLVCSWSSTVMKPRASRAMPAASRPRSSVFGPPAGRQQQVRGRGSPARPPAAAPTPSPSRRDRRGPWRRGGRRRPRLRACRGSAAETSSSSRGISRGASSDHRHRAAEAAEHLRELQADVAAADDRQMPRQGVEPQQAAVGQPGHRLEPRDRRRRGAAADVEEDPRRLQPLAVRPPPHAAAVKRAWPRTKRDVLGRLAATCSRPSRERPTTASLRAFTRGHVDADRAGEHDAVVRRAARHVRDAGAGDQGLGRGAAGVDAGAADRARARPWPRAGRSRPGGRRGRGRPGRRR